MILGRVLGYTLFNESNHDLYTEIMRKTRMGAGVRARVWGGWLLALGLAACGKAPEPPVTPPPPSPAGASLTDARRIELTPGQAAELRIETDTVRLRPLSYTVTLPGEVYPAPGFFARVSAPISGRVVRVTANEGEPVRRGQVLLELESLEFANLAAEYLQARAEETYRRSQVERLATLVEKKISPRAALDKAQADLARAGAAVSAAYARLRALNITEAQLEAWTAGETTRPVLPIHAPISGIIDAHDIDLGQSVEAYAPMMSILNPAEVLIKGFVSPEDAPLLRPGDPVWIGGQPFESEDLRAAVTTINPALDPANKSVTVNIRAKTRGGWPKPGQSVRLTIRIGSDTPAIKIPLSAVVYEGEQAIVFVRKDETTYERRPITVSRITSDEVIVAGGLREGESIAVSQLFGLKAIGRFEQYAE